MQRSPTEQQAPGLPGAINGPVLWLAHIIMQDLLYWPPRRIFGQLTGDCFSHRPRLCEPPVAQERLWVVDIFSELLYHNLSSFRGVPPRNRLARVAALVSQLFTLQTSQLQFVYFPIPEPAPHQ